MKKIISYAFTFALFSTIIAQNKELDTYKIIPMVQNIKTTQGQPFVLSQESQICYPKNDLELKQIATFLSEYIFIAKGIKLKISDVPLAKNCIVLEKKFKNDETESYQFIVNQDKILINGASGAGAFYGVQTLRKVLLINESKNTVSLPPIEITDFPRFAYRGTMLDVSRHFFPVEFVKKFIDLLAIHNINTFHWHLSDDQGWRIEIKKYPKLTQIGSKRPETTIGRNSGTFDGTPHSGFYTQEQIKDIVKYAKERFITVIPEIDMPGHMMAALASYPELGCTGGPYEVMKTWGISDEVLCAGNEKTFQFIEGVLSEIIPLFPSVYFHVGGDECPKVRWEKCPKCQARIKQLGLVKDDKHSAEEKLQSYTISRVEKFLNSKGKRLIGWDEILEGGIAPNATIMSWRGFKGGIEAAKQGHDVIMSPTSHCYYNFYQSKDISKEPFLCFNAFVELEKAYSFEPVPKELDDNQKKHILGGQANLWAEYISTPQQAEYMLLPRMAALSEVLWSNPESRNYTKFTNRLRVFLPAYDILGYQYAKHVLEK